MKLNFLLLFIFLSVILAAQDTLTTYFDEDWNKTRAKYASFYRKQVKIADKWQVFDYYLNGTLQMKGFCTNKKAKIKDGYFTYYYKNEKIELKGNYILDKKDGLWFSYYESGNRKSETNYENGEIIDSKNWKENGEEKFQPDVMPEFPGGDVALLKLLYGNIKYPDYCKENNIQGMVVFGFVIDKTGQIVDIKLLRSVHKAIDNESYRVLKMIQEIKWIPGTYKGEPIDVDYKLPINFKLENNRGSLKEQQNLLQYEAW